MKKSKIKLFFVVVIKCASVSAIKAVRTVVILFQI